MQQSFNNCITKLEEFKKTSLTENNIKRGKLYFTWINEKTEKIENEQNGEFIYKNVVKYTLRNYRIDKYIYERF